MSKLHGIVIADPAKSNLRFNKIENDHFTVTRKLPGKPQGPFVSEQDRLNNFDRYMPSLRIADTVRESTVPITETLNLELIDMWRLRRNNLRANVEKPQLEAEKKVSGSAVDTHEKLNPSLTTKTYGVSFGNHYNPKGNYPDATFTQDVRINMRYIHPDSSRLVNPSDYAKKSHYIYEKDYGNYQDRYYKNNTWKTAKGRVCLFERPFTRIFA